MVGDDAYVLADYVFVDEHNRHKRLKGKALSGQYSAISLHI